MGKLMKYLKDYKKESILGPLFKLLEASFELFVPLVMAKIIDVGIRNQDYSYILRMGGILIFLGIVGLLSSLTAQYYAAKAAVGFGTNLRNDLFSHINSLSFTEIDTVGTSSLITRMTSDINQVQSGVNLTLRLFLRSPFVVFGAMVMAFTINTKAALIFVIAIPLLSLVVFGIMLMSIPLYRKVQNHLDKVLLLTRENLVGTRVIRAFNKQEDEINNFNEASTALVKIQEFVGKISSMLNPVTYIIINLAIILVIWVGGHEVNNGIITQGAVVALVNYMSQILVELIKLANLIITLSKSLASAHRISSVFDIAPSIIENTVKTATPYKKSPKVEFRNMSFSYNNSSEEVLSNISFSVEPGQIIGIIGGTGSGKTTLINMIPRFYEATKGSVLVDGVDVRNYPLKELRYKIGLVPQKTALFKGTIRENIQWGKKTASDEEILRALDTAQIKEFIAEKREGLDFLVEKGGRNLSGGQKQRLTIARALVREPEILILDDSSSALDFATDAKLRKAITEDTKDKTVFIVSQRVSTIRNSDLILVMDDGNLAGIGDHKRLFNESKVYREICLSQLSKEEV